MQRIHVIFKTHLDIGFTDYARNVVASYFERFIPGALDTAEQLRALGSGDRFIWTTGSWLIYEYLEQAGPQERARMERAIAAGDIAWHGLPFTTLSELMDAGLFRFGLSLSEELDARFGKRTIAAKMTDVPGHSIGIVPPLAEAGVRFLHIGVNPASTPPDVPPVFRWRSASGAEVIVMYHKGSYGELMEVPGLEDAICFAHTNDNLGPQSVADVQAVFADLRARFPGAAVQGSTMDAFAAQLITITDQLPLVTQEIGDTWIHGVGSDPQKISQFRELLRLRQGWLDAGVVDEQAPGWKAFNRSMILVPEHTWGLDEKTHLADYQAYDARSFHAALKQEKFQRFAAAWDEQRAYLRDALAALEEPLAGQARAALQAIAPAYPDLSAFEALDAARPVETPFWRAHFDAQTGALDQLVERRSGRVWAGPHNPLGEFRYELFSQADYDRFYRQYIIHKREVAAWAVPDFTKPGMAAAGVSHQEWTAQLQQLYRRADADGQTCLLQLRAPELACTQFGCPRELLVALRFSNSRPEIEIDLQWFGKPACRLPEALWYSFVPAGCAPKGWRLQKMGQQISPLEVIRNGARHLHAVMPGVAYRDARAGLQIDSLDAPLVAPGERKMLDFTNRQPVLARGMHFLLFNNLWGTNTPMWYDEDARFRFRLRFE